VGSKCAVFHSVLHAALLCFFT